MCYAKPGPRCSSHAEERLNKAKASGGTDKEKQALKEYYLTPKGIAELESMGKHDEAKLMAKTRKKMIEQSKKSKLLFGSIKDIVYTDFHDSDYDGKNLAEETMKVLYSYRGKYGEPQVGRTRAVFDRGDGHVIKVPINFEGYTANSYEVRTSEMDDAYTPVADCYYDEEAENKWIPVVVMEKVTPTMKPYSELPEWVASVDGGQVGYTKDGKLVAYDL